MKTLKVALGTTMLVSPVGVSRYSNDEKNKELELRELGLSLREKEFALREKVGSAQGPAVRDSVITTSFAKAASLESPHDPLVANPLKTDGPLDKGTFSESDETLFYF